MKKTRDLTPDEGTEMFLRTDGEEICLDPADGGTGFRIHVDDVDIWIEALRSVEKKIRDD